LFFAWAGFITQFSFISASWVSRITGMSHRCSEKKILWSVLHSLVCFCSLSCVCACPRTLPKSSMGQS
jgi:hypothetical protein